jgi:RNA ligase (TIGR02306 family)
MRQLATIREIDNVQPIENADKIEVVTMKNLGWNVVSKKNEVKIGDKVVYFEIDSALPIEDRYEFLRGTSYKCWKQKEAILKECFRLKTIKLRGVVSQGLILPISLFPELKENKIGDDVTEILKVQHYDEIREIYGHMKANGSTNTGNTKGNFPSFITKSDQTRIQNLMNYFEEHKEKYFTAEAKYDGSSCTVYMVDKKYDKDQFGVCSRNYNLKRPCTSKLEYIKECLNTPCYPHNFFKRWAKRTSKIWQVLFKEYKSSSFSDFWNIINKCNLEEPLKLFFKETKRSIALQGEYVGPGVNGNRDKYIEHHYFIYDIYDVDNHTYLDANERHSIIEKLRSYNTKSIIEEVDTIADKIQIFKECDNLEKLLNYVNRKTLRGNILEGVVFKSIGMKPYFSFKCINNKYLLDEKD